jgi:hypothetical protein
MLAKLKQVLRSNRTFYKVFRRQRNRYQKWKARERVRKECEAVVDQYYNPEYQRKVFNASVCGVSATKLKLN